LELTHGDVDLASEWLANVTAWKDRPGYTHVSDLSDKAAVNLYASRANRFSADALAKFEAQRGAM
jgi:hypothetical protein